MISAVTTAICFAILYTIEVFRNRKLRADIEWYNNTIRELFDLLEKKHK